MFFHLWLCASCYVEAGVELVSCIFLMRDKIIKMPPEGLFELYWSSHTSIFSVRFQPLEIFFYTSAIWIKGNGATKFLCIGFYAQFHRNFLRFALPFLSDTGVFSIPTFFSKRSPESRNQQSLCQLNAAVVYLLLILLFCMDTSSLRSKYSPLTNTAT